MKEFKIVPIRNGTVLDHIEAGKSMEILQALGYPVAGSSKVVSVSMNLPSARGGHKDVLKFEDVELTKRDLDAVKKLSKRCTVSVIRNDDVAEKHAWPELSPPGPRPQTAQTQRPPRVPGLDGGGGSRPRRGRAGSQALGRSRRDRLPPPRAPRSSVLASLRS